MSDHAALASALVGEGYARFERYDPPRADAITHDLSDNTSLAGPAPRASQKASELASSLERYPSLWSVSLKEAVGRYLGVPAACVTTGAGSDRVLDAAVRAVARPGGTLAFMAPSFSLVPMLAHMNGLEPVPVPLVPRGDGGYDVDVERLSGLGATITYVCSPNNPTGEAMPREALVAVLERARGLVIVDEAYAEHGGDSVAALAVTHGRLLVTRTFSKAFGLAGLRVGYGVTTPELARELDKSRGPYAVSLVGELAAVEALTHDLAWMRREVERSREGRELLRARLRGLGLVTPPSSANFVLVPIEGADARARALAARGILVRALRLPVVGEALRMTAPPPELVVELWPALEAALGPARVDEVTT